MVDVFGHQLKPKDFVAYTSGIGNLESFAYAMYTEFDTFMLYTAWMNRDHNELFKNCKVPDTWYETPNCSKTSKKLACIKLYNLCKEEQMIYNTLLPLYERRMDSIRKYESMKRHLESGDIVVGRVDNTPYIYLGRVKDICVYKQVNGMYVLSDISDANLFYLSYWEAGSYLYTSVTPWMVALNANLSDLVTNKNNIVQRCLSFDERHLSYNSLSTQKSVRSNLYYFGHCDLGENYNKGQKEIIIPGFIQGESYILKIKLM